MAKGHVTELTAASASAALERLDRYLECVDELLRSPNDTSVHRRSSEHFEAMRELTASLPHVRICWVDVLISRFELLDGMCRTNGGGADSVARLHERHLEALDCFRRHCWDYISSNLEPRTQAERERAADTPETVLEAVRRRVQDAERHVGQQRELVARLEAAGADASRARKILRTMQDALDGMRRALEVANRLDG